MDKGRLLLQEKKGESYILKYTNLMIGLFGLGGMIYLVVMSIKGGYDKGFPISWGVIGGFICIAIVCFIMLYFCIFPNLRRTRFQIYENGIIPRYVPIKLWLQKGSYFIPWEKVIRATYADVQTLIPYAGAESYLRFQKKMFRYTDADYSFYFLDVIKPAVFGIGKEKMVNVAISPSKLVSPQDERIGSSKVLRILKDELKIQEKVKLIPYEEYVQIKGRAFTMDA